ncbi:MAG: phosphate ABC transporter substrate-binding protein [bacterium]
MRRAFAKVQLARCCIIAALIVGASRLALAQDGFVIIVNQANPATSLTEKDVSRIFLRKQATWPGGRRAQPVDQVESSPVRRKFSDAIHEMDVASVKSYWQELVFSGRGEPPPERASDADVVVFVRANVNAIGYVARTANVADVKTITLSK